VAGADATKNADGRLEIPSRADTARGAVYETRCGGRAGRAFGDAGVGPIAASAAGPRHHAVRAQLLVRHQLDWQQAPNDVFYLQWQILGGYLESAICRERRVRTRCSR
jgi:hypothetical protein